MMTRRVTPALPIALRPKPCASLCPTCSTGIAPNRVLASPQTLALTVLRSYGPRLCIKLSDAWSLSATIFLTKME